MGSYSFFSNPSFSNLFWTEPDEKDEKESPEVLLKRVTEPSYVEQIEIVRHRTDDSVHVTPHQTKVDNNTPESETIDQGQIQSTSSQTVPKKKQQTPEQYTLSEEHFPKLEHHIITDRVFDGLKASECFELFFDDEAPFSFSQFQETMGDINISYEKWTENDTPQKSFHPKPSSSCKHITRQLSRVTAFQTLTRSYFGPAYAEAKKIQIASFFSEDMVVMENKTILSGIPFGDKFFVLERWVLETKDDRNSMLNASVQVCMLSSCTFEGQIRKKSLGPTRDQGRQANVSSTGQDIRKSTALNLPRQSNDNASHSSDTPTSTQPHSQALLQTPRQSPNPSSLISWDDYINHKRKKTQKQKMRNTKNNRNARNAKWRS